MFTSEHALQLKNQINAWCEYSYQEDFRNHLGASVIGHHCERNLWYGFRWVRASDFDGRMLRLFKRGHSEEEKIIYYLEQIGFKVTAHTEDGKQIRFAAIDGHFGGSCDGTAMLPDGWNYDKPILLEFKTANANQFRQLAKKGVQVFKNDSHWPQKNIYGKKLGLEWALYICVCKDNDDLYIEFVKLDYENADMMEEKANDIIHARFKPRQASFDPESPTCKFCDYKSNCHNHEPSAVNCRSCKHSSPVENAQWKCNKFNAIIPKEYWRKACDSWEDVNAT